LFHDIHDIHEQMRELSLSCLSLHGFHRVNYYEWGDPANSKVAICVHGLTRNGRDFDDIAHALRKITFHISSIAKRPFQAYQQALHNF